MLTAAVLVTGRVVERTITRGKHDESRVTSPNLASCRVCLPVWLISAAQRDREVTHRGVDPLPQTVDSHQDTRYMVLISSVYALRCSASRACASPLLWCLSAGAHSHSSLIVIVTAVL